MNQVINIKEILACDNQKAFSFFTENSLLELWLCEKAKVEIKINGKFELFWDLNNIRNNSTVGCQINALEYGKLICFDWKGPQEFAEVMNNITPLTQVCVFFYPVFLNGNNSCEIFLIHSGWGRTEQWNKSREWFETAWRVALNKLAETVRQENLKKSW